MLRLDLAQSELGFNPTDWCRYCAYRYLSRRSIKSDHLIALS